jgi:translation initiation factor 1
MGKIVYSTDPQWRERCPVCSEAIDQCICSQDETGPTQQTVYLARDRKKRKGKTVTTITNLKCDLRSLQKELQKHCGAGGTVKNGIIEIQGDQRTKIQKYMEQKGYKVKLVGG